MYNRAAPHHHDEHETVRAAKRDSLAAADPAPTNDHERAVVDDLLLRADAARRRGALDEATTLLERVIADEPDHPEIVAVRMSLSRVLEQRGAYDQAARAYETLLVPGVARALREDARAGAARSWVQADRLERGRAHALAYLERSPHGPHAATMQAIAER